MECSSAVCVLINECPFALESRHTDGIISILKISNFHILCVLYSKIYEGY